jgi:hypothetical protein
VKALTSSQRPKSAFHNHFLSGSRSRMLLQFPISHDAIELEADSPLLESKPIAPSVVHVPANARSPILLRIYTYSPSLRDYSSHSSSVAQVVSPNVGLALSGCGRARLSRSELTSAATLPISFQQTCFDQVRSSEDIICALQDSRSRAVARMKREADLRQFSGCRWLIALTRSATN